jgi:hypothetical protein
LDNPEKNPTPWSRIESTTRIMSRMLAPHNRTPTARRRASGMGRRVRIAR